MKDDLTTSLEQATDALVSLPVSSWHFWIVWLLEDLDRTDEDYEEFLRKLKDEIEARLATGRW